MSSVLWIRASRRKGASNKPGAFQEICTTALCFMDMAFLCALADKLRLRWCFRRSWVRGTDVRGGFGCVLCPYPHGLSVPPSRFRLLVTSSGLEILSTYRRSRQRPSPT
jgi:hypothetical protein